MKEPFLTIGIIGTFTECNIMYNVNTYIAQQYDNYELIFCFENKHCIRIHDIIDTLNSHDFMIENRVKIFEERDYNLKSCVNKILKESSGEYVIFVSIEDAFYDSNGIRAIIDYIENDKSSIHVFKSIVSLQNGQEWLIYNYENNNTMCAVYSSSMLKDITIGDKLDNIITLNNDLIKDLSLNHNYNININSDLNILYHLSDVKKDSITQYYMSDADFYENAVRLVKRQNGDFNITKLRKSDHFKLVGLLSFQNSVHSKKNNEFIKILLDEFYICYNNYMNLNEAVSGSSLQFLSILSEIYKCLTEGMISKINYYRLKSRIIKYKPPQYKILFLTNEFSVWPSLKSVYEEALKDDDYNTQLVYVPFYHKFSKTDHMIELNSYINEGYDIKSIDEYNIIDEEPDIVIYVKPYDNIPLEYQVKVIKNIAAQIIYIPYAMEIGTTRECLYYQCYSNMQYYASKVLAYSPLYLDKMKRYTYTFGNNYLSIGHPRVDLRKRIKQGDSNIEKTIKDKAGERKIILWNTHFTIEEGDNWGSFLQYGEFILNYFKRHNNIFLLWRPHPLFYRALADVRSEEPDQTKKWIIDNMNYPNMYLDDSESYLSSFEVSDTMISDWASFVPEYLAYGKKVLVTKKQGSSDALLEKEKSDAFVIAQNIQDINGFLENIINGMNLKVEDDTLREILYLPENQSVASELLKIIKS